MDDAGEASEEVDNMIRIYGRCNSNPKGDYEIRTLCAASISRPYGWASYQCSRKRGYGEDGLLCLQHSKMDRVHVPEEEADDR